MHSPSNKQEQLRQLLNTQTVALQQSFPSNRRDALLALVAGSNRRFLQLQHTSTTPSVSSTGLQKALSLCLSNQNNGVSNETLDKWAETMLEACSRLAQAERVLAYCDTGFLHMQQGGNDVDYNLWIAGNRMPAEWREQQDLAAWTRLLNQTYAPEWEVLSKERISIQQQLAAFVQAEQGLPLYRMTRTIDDYYYRLGKLHVKCMVGYDTYPSNTSIGYCTFAVYRDVLGALIGLTLKQIDAQRSNIRAGLGTSTEALISCRSLIANELITDAIKLEPMNEVVLIETLTQTLALDIVTIQHALNACTLSAQNVSSHSSIMQIPLAPLIRLDEQHCVLSLEGLFTYPLFFLLRELRHTYSSEYHTASQLREDIFRQDVYALFADKRFVKSVRHVELRGTKGTLSTDVDALIFDRKTGALALFELKSQDPFAYSQPERVRQRDYFYGASRQVIAAYEWVKRNGAGALLSRLDTTQVKRFKAQNVYIFVLGRYLAHFFDGASFDGRAAWGTWAQVLQLTQGKAFGADDNNPIASLHSKLMKDTPLARSADMLSTVQEIEVGNRRIRVYPSFEHYRRS